MIILNYCNLIATSRHRAETSSRGRGRAGAEAGSGVAAGRPCSIGPSVAKTCARGEPGEREPQLLGSGIGIRPSGATQLGLAVGSRCFRGRWSPAWALCWLPGMARPRGPEGEVRVGSSAAWGLIRSRLTSNGAAAFGSVSLTHTTATSLPSRPPSCFHGGSRSPAALAEGS